MIYKKKIVIVAVSLIFSFVWMIGASHAASESWSKGKEAFFSEASSALKQAESTQASIYAPDAYKEGKEYYEAADKYYDKGNPKAAEKRLSKAVKYFIRAHETAIHAVPFFEKQAKVRDEANRVDAVKAEYETWKKAENLFRKAVSKYENGDHNKAREYSVKAEELFRQAELETIKTSYLSKVRKDIKAINDLGNRNNAKKTFEKAQRLVKKAEEQLNKQRYGNQSASKLIKEALYEIKHAKYIHNHVRKMKNSELEFEYLQLEAERSFNKIANELGIDAKFDKGFKKVEIALVEEIRKLNRKINKGDTKIVSLNETISELKEQISVMNSAEEKLRKERLMAEEALKRQKYRQFAKKKTIRNIRSTFTHNEGKVLIDGENIIIRLYGLNFPSGKSVIQPDYFGLLTKVRKSYNQFKDCELVIEGHTDSLGRDSLNQKLSEKRAEAVRQYLLANSAIAPDKINAIGYGEAKPVASNETKKGQAKNRRIDVVIIPENI